MKVGFIGFGEADSSIAAGLHEEGVEELLCYDAMQNDPKFAEKLKEKCRQTGAKMLESAALVGEQADVIFMAVPSNFSVSAVTGALPGLHPGVIYVDVSTATPADKKMMSAKVQERGAEYVDGAMMGPLLSNRHKVPMLLSGKAAAELKEKMDPWHMNMTVVGEVPGVATSMKFIRSITAKGIGCLIFESLQAAQRYGVEETIVESFVNSFGPEFRKVIDGYMSGAIIHADRREHELQNVVDFLRQDGLPCQMAEAVRTKLAWIRDTHVKENFEGDVPRNWQGVLAGWKLNDHTEKIG